MSQSTPTPNWRKIEAAIVAYAAKHGLAVEEYRGNKFLSCEKSGASLELEQICLFNLSVEIAEALK